MKLIKLIKYSYCSWAYIVVLIILLHLYYSTKIKIKIIKSNVGFIYLKHFLALFLFFLVTAKKEKHFLFWHSFCSWNYLTLRTVWKHTRTIFLNFNSLLFLFHEKTAWYCLNKLVLVFLILSMYFMIIWIKSFYLSFIERTYMIKSFSLFIQ